MTTDLWDQIDTLDDDGPVTHLVPVDDHVEHSTYQTCICGPECQMVEGVLVVAHWPLDRRA